MIIDIENSTPQDKIFIIEPWGDEEILKSGQKVRFSIAEGGTRQMSIDFEQDFVKFWLAGGSNYEWKSDN